MRRYYFDTRENDSVFHDEAGTLFPDDKAACDAARHALLDLLADQRIQDCTMTITVRDDQGVPFYAEVLVSKGLHLRSYRSRDEAA